MKSDAVSEEKKVEKSAEKNEKRPKEFGGPKGLEPTRFGDWEKKGRCIDF
jgi:hypothetical protein